MATPSHSVLERTLQVLEGEVGRRLVHASGAILPALYLIGLLSWQHVMGLFVLGTAVVLVLEWLRLSGVLELWVHRHLTREYEQDTIAGYVLYMLSATVVVVLFTPSVAVPAIFMLTLADPVSGVVSSGGLRRVKRPPALATMFLVSTLLAAPFHFSTPLAVLFGGAGAMIADGVKLQIRGTIVDDNLTIPIVAAIAMQAGIELSALL